MAAILFPLSPLVTDFYSNNLLALVRMSTFKIFLISSNSGLQHDFASTSNTDTGRTEINL